VAVGVPFGIVLGWYQRLFYAFDPLITALYATPRIALYPLFIIWFGIGSPSKIFIVFLSAVLPVVVNTIAGVRNIDPDLLKAAAGAAGLAASTQSDVTAALRDAVAAGAPHVMICGSLHFVGDVLAMSEETWPR